MRIFPNRGGALQFVRFAVVGLISNALLFFLYFVATGFGIGHKLAATLIYALGVLQTFFFNRSWTFRDAGSPGPTFFRYVITYAFGYFCNMAVLVVLVDQAGYSHQIVQAFTIIALAVMLFLLQKFWVFCEQSKG